MSRREPDRKTRRKTTKKPAKAKPWLYGDDFKLDYKDVAMVRRFINEKGKILPRRLTGASARHQRIIAQAVKRAREMALIPYPQGR